MPFRWRGNFSSAEKLWFRKYTDCKKWKHLMALLNWFQMLGITKGAIFWPHSAQSSRKIANFLLNTDIKALWILAVRHLSQKNFISPNLEYNRCYFFLKPFYLRCLSFLNWNSTRKYASYCPRPGSLSTFTKIAVNSLQVQVALHELFQLLARIAAKIDIQKKEL